MRGAPAGCVHPRLHKPCRLPQGCAAHLRWLLRRLRRPPSAAGASASGNPPPAPPSSSPASPPLSQSLSKRLPASLLLLKLSDEVCSGSGKSRSRPAKESRVVLLVVLSSPDATRICIKALATRSGLLHITSCEVLTVQTAVALYHRQHPSQHAAINSWIAVADCTPRRSQQAHGRLSVKWAAGRGQAGRAM